jgi:hypothetical protein
MAIALQVSGCGDNFKSEAGPPTDGLVLWLRADRGVTEQNGVVTKWEDQAGHTDAVQTSVDFRPRLDSGALGGMGALVFDGVDDLMNLSPGFADFTQGLSFFSTYSIDRDNVCTAILEVSNGSEIDDIHFGRNNGQPTFEISDQYNGGQPVDIGSPQLYSVIQHPDENVELRINSTTVGAFVMAVPANVTRQQNLVGFTLYAGCSTFGGQIGEILLYDRPVNNEELLDVEAYLGKHAGCCQ